jgi:hypothetical protein
MRPCADCVNGRCTMNCGPAVPVVQSSALRRQDLREDLRRRQSAKAAKSALQTRKLRDLHECVRVSRCLVSAAMECETADFTAVIQAAVHYARLAQSLGETTFPAPRTAWREYLREGD